MGLIQDNPPLAALHGEALGFAYPPGLFFSSNSSADALGLVPSLHLRAEGRGPPLWWAAGMGDRESPGRRGTMVAPS